MQFGQESMKKIFHRSIYRNVENIYKDARIDTWEKKYFHMEVFLKEETEIFSRLFPYKGSM